MCAVDGSTLSDIKPQIRNAPGDASRFVVSVGGNDALMNIDLLSDATLPGPLLLTELARIAERFRADYMKAIERVCRLKKPVILCTIYNGDMARDLAAPLEAAVAVFDDKIYSTANEKRLTVIDLRRICTLPADYANPIESSDIGGRKIANAVLEHVKALNNA